MAEPPGPVARSQDELVEVLLSGAEAGAGSATRRAAFRDRYCSLEDGHAAERVVRRLWPDASTASPLEADIDLPMHAHVHPAPIAEDA